MIKGEIVKVLEAFNHRTARRITGKTARNVMEEGWELPPEEEAIEAAGIWSMRECVRRQQAIVSDYLFTRPIF